MLIELEIDLAKVADLMTEYLQGVRLGVLRSYTGVS
jgi:hypothetical protein